MTQTASRANARPAPTLVAAPAARAARPAPQAVPDRAQHRRLARRVKQIDVRAIAVGAAALALFLLAWHLATRYRIDLYIRFLNVPSPAEVFERAVSAFDSPVFMMNIGISMRRILLGFGIAAALGVPLGLLMGRFRLVHEFIFPVAEVLRPIPAIAWVPMSIMLWPTSEASIVFITFLGSFFPILINTLHGMATLDKVLVRAARCLGASELSLFLTVYLPGTLPHIFTGLTVGMGVAWVSLIAAEMISGQFGIGYFTWEAYSLVQYADIALGMICIGVLGLVCSGAIRALGATTMPWMARQRRGER
jgi:NitT/TauT family transport system permease protein